ncbi:MAG: hypothetical protein ACXW20_00695 [Burkholderiales bacterium]
MAAKLQRRASGGQPANHTPAAEPNTARPGLLRRLDVRGERLGRRRIIVVGYALQAIAIAGLVATVSWIVLDD